MKYAVFLATVLASSIAAGCGTFTAVTPGPAADKIYVTKTSVFLVFADSKVQLCNAAGSSVSACQDVKVE